MAKTGGVAFKQMGRMFIVLVVFAGVMILVRKYALGKTWTDSI